MAIKALQKGNKQSGFESLRSLAWPPQLPTQWKLSDFKLPKWSFLKRSGGIYIVEECVYVCGGERERKRAY